jgi:hypothetical protein
MEDAVELVPNHAPFVVMAFLLTGVSLGLAGVGFLLGLKAKKWMIVRISAFVALGIAGVYGAACVGSALASHERTLAPGELNYFCEIDCHLAYSVTGVRSMRTVGSGPTAVHAKGTFYVVTLRTWFDPKTISSQRPLDAALWPNPRQVALVDARGRIYSTSLLGQRALGEPSVPLTQELRPGESYETRLVFDLPSDARSPRLLLADAFPLSPLLIGHEMSPFHRKVYFQLPAAS